MVSNATAVPQTQSEPIMKIVSDNKQQVTMLEEIFEVYIGELDGKPINVQPKGIFDTILAIIRFLIDLVNKIIEFILKLIQIGELILALINAINALINVITQFIEWLRGLFNPKSIAAI
jgi:hypothetical protein